MAKAKPNLDWLEQARDALNADPAFRKLGSADFRLGLVLGDEARLVRFEAFEVAGIDAADPADMRDADVILEMSPKDWNAYLRRRGRGKGETLLSLDLTQRVVRARQPLQRLLFERYNRTIQAFVDCGSGLQSAP